MLHSEGPECTFNLVRTPEEMASDNRDYNIWLEQTKAFVAKGGTREDVQAIKELGWYYNYQTPIGAMSADELDTHITNNAGGYDKLELEALHILMLQKQPEAK